MNGYLVTFYTQESRTYQKTTLADWILDQAKAVGVQGATLMSGKAGFGHDGRFHSDSYFDLEDRPVQIVMAVREIKFEPLMEKIRACGQRIFYTKAPIEFGFTVE